MASMCLGDSGDDTGSGPRRSDDLNVDPELHPLRSTSTEIAFAVHTHLHLFTTRIGCSVFVARKPWISYHKSAPTSLRLLALASPPDPPVENA